MLHPEMGAQTLLPVPQSEAWVESEGQRVSVKQGLESRV